MHHITAAVLAALACAQAAQAQISRKRPVFSTLLTR